MAPGDISDLALTGAQRLNRIEGKIDELTREKANKSDVDAVWNAVRNNTRALVGLAISIAVASLGYVIAAGLYG